MKVDISEISDQAAVWVYQSSRPFSSWEYNLILESANEFIDKWAAHGNPLKAAVDIRENQFIILAVDEEFNQASGCSIDNSVNFIKTLEEHLNRNKPIALLDNSMIAFKDEEGRVFLEHFKDIKNKIAEGVINANTITFNNRINTKKQLDQNWQIPSKESWMGRYFNSLVT